MLAAGTRKLDLRGDGRLTIPSGGIAVTGGMRAVDIGYTITAGGLNAAATTDVNVGTFSSSSSSYSSDLLLVAAARAANSAFFLEELTAGGSNMFTVRRVLARLPAAE